MEEYMSRKIVLNLEVIKEFQSGKSNGKYTGKEYGKIEMVYGIVFPSVYEQLYQWFISILFP